MIDENEDCITKSKLPMTFSKYNGRSRVVAKQTNRLTDA